MNKCACIAGTCDLCNGKMYIHLLETYSLECISCGLQWMHIDVLCVIGHLSFNMSLCCEHL